MKEHVSVSGEGGTIKTNGRLNGEKIHGMGKKDEVESAGGQRQYQFFWLLLRLGQKLRTV